LQEVNKIMKEQRQHERYEVKDGALVVFGSNSARTGQIVNMGHGGLSFIYKGNREIANDPLKVSIVFDREGVVKYGPFKFNANIVSDVEVEDKSMSNSSTTKRCHIQFSDLSYHQKLWLEDCIRSHTTGAVRSFVD